MSTDFKIVREIVVDGVVFKTTFAEPLEYSIYNHRTIGGLFFLFLKNKNGQKTFQIFHLDGKKILVNSGISFPSYQEDPNVSFQDSLYWDEIVAHKDHLELISKNITYIIQPENLRCFSEIRSNFPKVLSYRILERTKIEVQGQIHDLNYPIVDVGGFSDIGYIVQTNETLDYQNIYRFDTNGNFTWRIPVPPFGRTKCDSFFKETSSEDYIYSGWKYLGSTATHIRLYSWYMYERYEFNIETGALEFLIHVKRWGEERSPVSHEEWLKRLANPDLMTNELRK